MSHLTQEQRYTIEILYNEKYSQTDIAKIIFRDKSVVNRELKRNSDKRSNAYKADLAERKCKQRHKEKPKQIRFTKAIKEFVIYYSSLIHIYPCCRYQVASKLITFSVPKQRNIFFSPLLLG